MNFQLRLHETPPSLNTFGSVGGGTHHRYRRLKKQWQEQLGRALMQAAVPRGMGRVKATAALRFPRAAKRDEGNFRFLLEKALGDILVEGGWLKDDTAGRFSFGALQFVPDLGDPLTLVFLEVEREDPDSDLAAPDTAENSQLESGVSNPRRGDLSLSGRGRSGVLGKRRWRRGVKG